MNVVAEVQFVPSAVDPPPVVVPVHSDGHEPKSDIKISNEGLISLLQGTLTVGVILGVDGGVSVGVIVGVTVVVVVILGVTVGVVDGVPPGVVVILALGVAVTLLVIVGVTLDVVDGVPPGVVVGVDVIVGVGVGDGDAHIQGPVSHRFSVNALNSTVVTGTPPLRYANE